MEVLKTNMNELCFFMENFSFKHEKKVKFDDGVDYYCHCDRKPNECLVRAIVSMYHNSEISFKLRKKHNGHTERIKGVNSRRFMGNLKGAALL